MENIIRFVTYTVRSFSAEDTEHIGASFAEFLKHKLQEEKHKRIRIAFNGACDSGKSHLCIGILSKFEDAAIKDEIRTASFKIRHHSLRDSPQYGCIRHFDDRSRKNRKPWRIDFIREQSGQKAKEKGFDLVENGFTYGQPSDWEYIFKIARQETPEGKYTRLITLIVPEADQSDPRLHELLQSLSGYSLKPEGFEKFRRWLLPRDHDNLPKPEVYNL